MDDKTELTIGQLVADDFRKAEVFKRFGIDFCCGGKEMLERSCTKKGIDVTAVKQALKELDEQLPKQFSQDYQNWDLDFLIDYITKTHHKYVNDALPILDEYSSKVARVHEGTHPEVAAIASLYQELASELRMHMDKEETILFPYIQQMAYAERHNQVLPASPFGMVKNPIEMMETEHDSAGGNMQAIRELSNEFNPPEEVCMTYKVLYAKLQEFENDLHQHVHLENNILFPRAIKLEISLRNNANRA